MKITISETCIQGLNNINEDMNKRITTNIHEYLKNDFKNYQSFLKSIESSGGILKVFVNDEFPCEYADVIFTDLKKYKRAFSAQPSFYKENDLKMDIEYIKNMNITEDEKSKLIEKVTAESFIETIEFLTISENIKSKEDIIKITKTWLVKFFPEIHISNVIFDDIGLSEHIKKEQLRIKKIKEEDKMYKRK